MAKGDDAGGASKYGGNAYGGFFKPTGTAVSNPQMGSGSNPMGSTGYGVGPSRPLPSGNRFGYNNPAPPMGYPGMGNKFGFTNPKPPMGNAGVATGNMLGSLPSNRFGYNNPAPPVSDNSNYGGNIDSGPGYSSMNPMGAGSMMPTIGPTMTLADLVAKMFPAGTAQLTGYM